MGTGCSMTDIYSCICGEEYDRRNMDRHRQSLVNHGEQVQKHMVSDDEFDMDLGIEEYHVRDHRKHKHQQSIDLSDLRRKLGRKLIKAEIISGNQLQLMFSQTGFVIDPSQCEMCQDGQYTLHIVDGDNNHALKQDNLQITG